MPVYATNPNKANPPMKIYYLELIIGDKISKREIHATSLNTGNLNYSFYENNTLVALYPINNTVIYSIETLEE